MPLIQFSILRTNLNILQCFFIKCKVVKEIGEIFKVFYLEKLSANSLIGCIVLKNTHQKIDNLELIFLLFIRGKLKTHA